MKKVAIVSVLLLSCSGAKPIPKPNLKESCASIAKQIERKSPLTDGQKRAYFKPLEGKTFQWMLRIMAVSELADNLDKPTTYSVDAECVEMARNLGDGSLRYIFTVYFGEEMSATLKKLSRGQPMHVRGTLVRYEGKGAFSAKGVFITQSFR